MKIGYISDIHIDFYVKLNKERLLQKFVNSLHPQQYDILIIAGDIGHYNQQNIALLRYLKEFAPHIIVTIGNHELYLVSDRMKRKYHRNSLKKVQEFKNLCKDNGIICLDMEAITIKGVTIGGGCIWYKVDEKQREFWKNCISDAKYVYLPHQEFYKERLEKFYQLPQCDIFVSHIPQTKVSQYLPPSFDEQFLPFYEQENITLLHEKGIHYSIYGHNHTQGAFLKENIHFLTCGIGYPYEKLPKRIGVFHL